MVPGDGLHNEPTLDSAEPQSHAIHFQREGDSWEAVSPFLEEAPHADTRRCHQSTSQSTGSDPFLTKDPLGFSALLDPKDSIKSRENREERNLTEGMRNQMRDTEGEEEVQ